MAKEELIEMNGVVDEILPDLRCRVTLARPAGTLPRHCLRPGGCQRRDRDQPVSRPDAMHQRRRQAERLAGLKLDLARQLVSTGWYVPRLRFPPCHQPRLYTARSLHSSSDLRPRRAGPTSATPLPACQAGE